MDLIDSTVKLLVTQQHSRELYGRHVAAIEALCRDNPTGFAVRDLPRIVQVLQIAINLISSGESAFVQPVCCLIRLVLCFMRLSKQHKACNQMKQQWLQLRLLLLVHIQSFNRYGFSFHLELNCCTRMLYV